MIKLLTLFGGIGAPEKALINLGVDTKLIDYVEIDEKAVRTYNALYHHLQKHKSQSVIGWTYQPDILVHGSPCQDFSRAGTRLGGKTEDKTRSSLMWETLRIVKSFGPYKPKVVIWENVKGVKDKDNIKTYNKYLDHFTKLGYYTTDSVLNSMDFGIPQDRDRNFAISVLDGYFNFNQINKTQTKHINEFLETTEEEQYLVTQPSMIARIGKENAYQGRYLRIIDDHCKTITNKQMRCPNAGIIDLGNEKYRYLTERECWRLQGFTDDDFDRALKEHPSQDKKLNGTLYKQAGNSITVQVLEAIFEQIHEQGILDLGIQRKEKNDK